MAKAFTSISSEEVLRFHGTWQKYFDHLVKSIASRTRQYTEGEAILKDVYSSPEEKREAKKDMKVASYFLATLEREKERALRHL